MIHLFMQLFLLFVAIVFGIGLIITMAIGAYKAKDFAVALGQWIAAVWMVAATGMFVWYGVKILEAIK